MPSEEPTLETLVDAFDEESQMAQLVRAAAGRSLHRVAMGKDLEEITAKVIQSAQNQGWLPALIKEAWQARQSDPVLTRFHEAWKVPAAEAPVDHRKVLLLPGKTVLIDRGPLRDALMTLEDANGSRVLIVDGDPESGKTYSFHYISPPRSWPRSRPRRSVPRSTKMRPRLAVRIRGKLLTRYSQTARLSSVHTGANAGRCARMFGERCCGVWATANASRSRWLPIETLTRAPIPF